MVMKKTIRAIVPTDINLQIGQQVKLGYNKIFVFDKTGARLL